MCLEGPTKPVGVVSIIDHHESKPASEISESNILKEATVLAIRTPEWMRAMTVEGHTRRSLCGIREHPREKEYPESDVPVHTERRSAEGSNRFRAFSFIDQGQQCARKGWLPMWGARAEAFLEHSSGIMDHLPVTKKTHLSFYAGFP